MKYKLYFEKFYHLKAVSLEIDSKDLCWNVGLDRKLEKLSGIKEIYDYRINLYTNEGRLVYVRKNHRNYIDFRIYPVYKNFLEKFWLRLKCKLGFHDFKNYQLSSCHLNTSWGSIKCGHCGYYCSQPQYTCASWVVQCSHCGKKRFANEINLY